ncbi:MAG: hypothetical protein Q6L60_15090 [Thermostichus sp. HHBFW_bins_43]
MGIFARLASDGSILQFYERGDQIQAQVQGSELEPYRAQVHSAHGRQHKLTGLLGKKEL